MNRALRIWSGASVIGGSFLGAANLTYGQAVCQEAMLTASDPGVFESFGYSVAVWGDTALIGAEWDRELGTEAGAAYVFRRQGLTWAEAQKLLASDGHAWDNFGLSLAMDGDVAVIGAGHVHDDGADVAYGAVYVFRYGGATWVEEQELLASDSAFQDGFSLSVSVSGGVTVVGAVGDDDNGAQSGSAYVFRYDSKSDTWVEEQKLLPSDQGGADQFGRAVSLDGDTAVIGAWSWSSYPGGAFHRPGLRLPIRRLNLGRAAATVSRAQPVDELLRPVRGHRRRDRRHRRPRRGSAARRRVCV